MTTSSSEQLPARSPRPLMVHSTWRAPPIFTPASELATAMPRSLWQCTDQMALSELGTARAAADEVAVQLGNGVAHGVGMLMVVAPSAITASTTRPGSPFRAVAVLGRELDVVAQVARKAHRQPGLLQHLFGRHAQLLLHVQRAGGDEGVDAAAGGAGQRLGGAADVAVVGARQRADGGVLDLPAIAARPRSRRWSRGESRPRSRPRRRSSWRAMRSFSSRVIEAPGTARRRARWCRK
jgi:hypothetical protein